MGEEQLGKFWQVNGVMGRDEEGLFGQAVDYYQDRSVSLRCQKLFDEVHGDGFPWSWGNWQLFEKTIWFVLVCLGTCAYHTGLDVLFDHLGKSQPMTRPVDQVNGFAMAKVTHHWMVMVVADLLEMEWFGYIDASFVPQVLLLPFPTW